MKITRQLYFYSDDLIEWIGPVSSINLIYKVLKGEVKESTKIWYSELCPEKMLSPYECSHTDRAIHANELGFLPQFLFKTKQDKQDKKMMTIKMLQALNGDCFLINIQGEKEHNILIDTGYEQTYNSQLLPLLQDISKRGKSLDLCVITHIDNDHIDCLLYAFENGITALDTSPSYSNSEKYVGKALKQWRGERPFISTKVGRLQSASAFDATLDYSEREIRNAIAVNDIAKKYGLPLPTLAQRYLFSMNEATRVVMGARKINQIQNTINDWQQGALPEAIFNEITNVLI